jgi:hypothetical protein
MFMEIGVPLAEGATTALPPTREDFEKLLAVAPKYGIEIRLRPAPGRRHSSALAHHGTVQ